MEEECVPGAGIETTHHLNEWLYGMDGAEIKKGSLRVVAMLNEITENALSLGSLKRGWYGVGIAGAGSGSGSGGAGSSGSDLQWLSIEGVAIETNEMLEIDTWQREEETLW